MHSNLKSNILTQTGINNLAFFLTNLESLICLELILYQTNLTESKIEKLTQAIASIKNLNKLVINLARNDLEDVALSHINTLFGNFAFLEHLEIHIYGNKFTKEIVLDFLDTVSCIGLKSFILSIKEFVVNRNEFIDDQVLRKFEALVIKDKEIC